MLAARLSIGRLLCCQPDLINLLQRERQMADPSIRLTRHVRSKQMTDMPHGIRNSFVGYKIPCNAESRHSSQSIPNSYILEFYTLTHIDIKSSLINLIIIFIIQYFILLSSFPPVTCLLPRTL